MLKRLILLSAIAGMAFAQQDDGDPDIPQPFRGLISEQQYLEMRAAHIDLLRGLPADPALREQAIQQMQQQIQQLQALRTQRQITPLASASALVTWKQLGPGPIPNGQTQGVVASVSGRATAIAIDPANENNVYIGTAQGGVYRTLDGGTTWTQIFNNQNTSAIGALALDAANGRLYVGTGEANGSIDSFAGVGLFRIDNVNTVAAQAGPINPVRFYTDVNNVATSAAVFTGRAISTIVILPNDPTTLFVGTTGGEVGSGGDAPFGGTVPPLGLRGLYKLTGVTGSPANVGVLRIGVRSGLGIEGCFDNPCTGNRNVNSIVLDPGDPSGNTLLLWLNGTNVANDGGVWRSTNAMSATPTFTQSFATTSTTTSNGRGQLAIYKQGSNPAVVYAASGEPVTATGTTCTVTTQGGAMRVSTDGGITFGAKLAGSGGFCGGQCFYNVGLDVLPGPTTATSDDIIFLGGQTRSTNNCSRLGAKSIDGGATFIDPATSGLHADTHYIKIAPSNPNVVYHLDDGGAFKSTDGGATWASVNPGLNTIQFTGLAVHPTNQNFTIGGSQDNGTSNLKADGTTWNRIDFGDGGYSLIDQNATDTTNVTMYHTYYNSSGALIGFARVDSTAAAVDGNWSFYGCNGVSGNGISCTDRVLFYVPLAQGPGNPNTVYVGTDRVYRSVDKGLNNVVVSQAPLSATAVVSSIAISPQDDNYRLVGLNNGGLYFTTTGSSTLTVLDPIGSGGVIPDRFVGRVLFDPTNKNTAYIALGGYMGSTTPANSHLWKVTNLSTTPVLTPMTGMPDVPMNAIAVDPTNSNNVFSGTDIGVFASPDGGTTWAPYGTGLPVVAVFDAKVQPTSGVLRIATHGRGMWEASPVLGTTKLASLISSKTGPATGSRTWTIQVSNQGPAFANATQITGITLTQTSGPACVPSVESAFPVLVGNIANGASASAGIVLNFPAGCSSADRFTVNINLSANDGAATATTIRNNERP